MRTLPLLLLLALCACSEKANFEKLCNAEKLSGVTETNPADKATQIALWIEKNVHGDARKVVQSLAAVPADRRGPILKQAAHEGGYDGPCPMAEMK